MKDKLIISILLINILLSSSVNYRLSPNQNKKLRQAKSLNRNGLVNEAKNIYNELLLKNSHLKEAYIPLKEILKKNEDWIELKKITEFYLNNNKKNIQVKIDVLDAFIWLNDPIWEKHSKEIIYNKIIKDRDIKRTLNILLNNKKYDFINNIINQLRKTKKPDYYSYEMGMHFSINMQIENSIKEFLLHLEYNPKKYTMIKNRILSYHNEKNNQIKSILINHNSYQSKLILADIEFKQNNLNESYQLIKEYSVDENDLINFSEDLIQIQEYEFAQDVIETTLNNSSNELIIKKSIIQLAKIFEQLIVLNKYNLPISKQILKNELFSSPFIKINPDKLYLLEQAIQIYDSLRINNNDIESTYQLAEIKYKILGDLDAASNLYSTIIKNNRYNNSEFYTQSIIKNIDVLISKGNVDKAYQLLNENKNKINDDDYIGKESQILFYLNDWEKFKNKTNEYLKNDIKDKNIYNDILKITNDVTLFNEDINNLNIYAKALLKLYQNKRTESLAIMNLLTNNSNIEISNKIIYELSYLKLKQGNIEEALLILEKSKQNTAFNESILLLKAEIYDYVLNNKIEAINLYLMLLDNYPNSIHYDIIRLRLRELAS